MSWGRKLGDFLAQDISNPLLKVGFLAVPIVVAAIGLGGIVNYLTKPTYPVNVDEQLTFELRQRPVSFGCLLPHERPVQEWPRMGRIDPKLFQQIFDSEFAALDALADYDNFRFRLIQVGEEIPGRQCLSKGILKVLSDTACVILRPTPYLETSDKTAIIAYANAYNREIAKLANNDKPCLL